MGQSGTISYSLLMTMGCPYLKNLFNWSHFTDAILLANTFLLAVG